MTAVSIDHGSLPPTLSTAEAADLFGCSTNHLYELAHRGQAPIEPLRLGRKLRWPTRHVLDVLGLSAPPVTEENHDTG